MKVSILIPVFNRQDFIAECVQSALTQTFSDLEVVIVDNASSDNTWKICQNFAEKDSRVRIFRNETNIGPVRNWLRCVAEARGDYGKFLFSDDLMFPEFLEICLPYMNDNRVAFVSCAALIGESLQSASINYKISGDNVVVSVHEYLKILCLGNQSVSYSPGSAIFRMSDIRNNLLDSIQTNVKHDFSTNGAGPDILLFTLTAINYDWVVMIQDPLVFFRSHAGSITIANDNNCVSEGYQLALAWFFIKYADIKYWYRWVAGLWISEIIIRKNFFYPNWYLRKYEGSGNVTEILTLVIVAIKIIFPKIKKKLF